MNLRVGQPAQGRGTSPCGATSPSSQVSHLLETISIASHPGGKGREGKAAGAGLWTSDGLTDPEPDVDCGNWGWDWKVPALSDVSGRSIPEKPSGPTEEVHASQRVTLQELGVEERQNPSKGRRRAGTCERKRGRPGLGNLLKWPWGL